MKPKHVAKLSPNGDPDIVSGEAPTTAVEHAERVTLDQLDENHHPMLKRAIAAARRWASLMVSGHERVSLVLTATQVMKSDGKPDHDLTGCGCGKTHIARAIQWASFISLEDGTPVAPAGRFYLARDLIQLLGAGNTMQELCPPPADTTDGGRIGGTPVLVIDDVGKEGTLPFVAAAAQASELQTRYFAAINYCFERKISVVLTANLSVDQLAKHVGGPAWSRIQEMAPAGLIIDLTGVPDYRRVKGGRA